MALHSSTPLVGFADIQSQSIEDWGEFQQEGLQYLKLAEAAHQKKKKVFTTEILYNLIAMAIEKLVMAALMKIGRLPYNHTMHDLVDALEQWLPQTIEGMAEPIKALDSYQDICDPDNYSITAPTAEEIEHMLELTKRLEARLQVVIHQE